MIALVPIETWLEELWREKKQHIKSEWKFRRVVEKIEIGIEKNKLLRRPNVVEKSQSEL